MYCTCGSMRKIYIFGHLIVLYMELFKLFRFAFIFGIRYQTSAHGCFIYEIQVCINWLPVKLFTSVKSKVRQLVASNLHHTL